MYLRSFLLRSATEVKTPMCNHIALDLGPESVLNWNEVLDRTDKK
jgi:hypothetical protein